MRQKGGYWKRPVSRTYMYNLDVGEHYYSPLTTYLDAERGTRGETPGALTFDERLARNWLHGRRYEATEARDRYARASSMSRGETQSSASYLASDMAARSARSASEMRTASSRQQATSVTASRQQMIAQSMASQRQQSQRSEMRSTAQEQRMSSASSKKQVSMASSSSQQQESRMLSESKRRIDDDICKKVADIHMSPWSKGQELDEANAASLRARQRIAELERELEEITRKAMTSTSVALKTAKQMAMEATREDELAVANSYSKSKKVLVESSSRIH